MDQLRAESNKKIDEIMSNIDPDIVVSNPEQIGDLFKLLFPRFLEENSGLIQMARKEGYLLAKEISGE